jgi:NADPH:quinone reductase-like Zn-dependent oxidoreductase
MRAYRVTGVGIDNIKLSEEARPAPGPGEVLIRMRACSLNFRDLLTTNYASIPSPMQPGPFIPVSDGAGEVVEVGAGVNRVSVGQRVMGNFHPDWIYGPARTLDYGAALGGGVDGMLAEYRVLAQHSVVPVPDYLSYAEAATLPCAGVTAWNALRNVRADETVLLLGTGGVSIIALQIAKAAGARVIITSSSDEKLARARTMGADETVNYKQHPEWQEEVKRLTGGIGADHVVEVGGGGTMGRSVEACAPAGHVHVIGVLTQGELDPTHLILKSLNMRGILVGSRQHFEELCAFVTQHEIHPPIDREFSFDEALDAYRYLESGSHFGKLVINFAD